MLSNGIIREIGGNLQWSNNRVTGSKNHTAALVNEFFEEKEEDCTKVVSILDPLVDFGSCSRYKLSSSRTVRIANQSKGKVTCVWVNAPELNGYVSNNNLVDLILFCKESPLLLLFRPVQWTLLPDQLLNSNWNSAPLSKIRFMASKSNATVTTKVCEVSA